MKILNIGRIKLVGACLGGSKKAMKGELGLMGPAMKVESIPDFSEPRDALFEREKGYVKNIKKAIFGVACSAAQNLMMTLAKEQEILVIIADMAIWIYAAESA